MVRFGGVEAPASTVRRCVTPGSRCPGSPLDSWACRECSLRTSLLVNLADDDDDAAPTLCRTRSEMTTEKDQDLLDLQTTDSFRLYLDEVGRHPLLTKDDEIELSQAFEAGQAAQTVLRDLPAGDPDRRRLETEAARGERARRKMIESNLRLVVSIARRFSATGLPLGDLV